MERDLIKFNENIAKVSKDICKYEDEKGNLMLIPTGQLFASSEYMELDEVSYKKALFEKIINKDLEYTEIKVTKTIDKSTKTGNKKDQGTLIDSEVLVKQVWVVKNGVGLAKSFNNITEALNLVNGINKKYFEIAELV